VNIEADVMVKLAVERGKASSASFEVMLEELLAKGY
jgi:hypothetical protein